MKNERKTTGSGRQRDGKYDPYARDPGAGLPGDDRVKQADEMQAHQREDADLNQTNRLDDSTTAPIIHTGITGQTARGSYGFNDSTGQGQYMDRTRDGSADVGADPIDQVSDHFAGDEAAGDELRDDEDRNEQ